MSPNGVVQAPLVSRTISIYLYLVQFPPSPFHNYLPVRFLVVRLHVDETNMAARALYRKLGFRDRGRMQAYYNNGGHAIKMEIEIAELKCI